MNKTQHLKWIKSIYPHKIIKEIIEISKRCFGDKSIHHKATEAYFEGGEENFYEAIDTYLKSGRNV